MKTNQRQRGMAMSSWMIIIALAGFFLTIFFKMGPVYLENHGVRSALASMAQSSRDLNELDRDEIYGQISRYFTINNVRSVKVKDLKIVRMEDKTLINHDYETRVPLFLNVDVVMKFRNQVDSSNIEACCKYLIEDEQKDDSN